METSKRVVTTTMNYEMVTNQVEVGNISEGVLDLRICVCGKPFREGDFPIHMELLHDKHNPKLMEECPACHRKYFFVQIVNVFQYSETVKEEEYDADGNLCQSTEDEDD
jgi:hypothetical protein